MDTQTSDLHISSHTIRYDPLTDSISFQLKDVAIQKHPISFYITALRDTERQSLVGVQFNELRMMALTLITNGALKIGSPLPLEDVLCAAERLSGNACDLGELFQEIRQMIKNTYLPTDEINDTLEYPMGWN